MIIKNLEPRDYDKVIEYAIEGMNFRQYFNHELALRLYGRYFLYLELNKVTDAYAAYGDNGEFLGTLLFDSKQGEKSYKKLWQVFYVTLFKFILKFFFGKSAGQYDQINKKMLASYLKKNHPDGEILLFAVDPQSKGNGVGTALLHYLEQEQAGKQIYLFTDSGCTYQFYDRRDFKRVEEEKILLEHANTKQELRCMLYSRTL